MLEPGNTILVPITHPMAPAHQGVKGRDCGLVQRMARRILPGPSSAPGGRTTFPSPRSMEAASMADPNAEGTLHESDRSIGAKRNRSPPRLGLILRKGNLVKLYA